MKAAEGATAGEMTTLEISLFREAIEKRSGLCLTDSRLRLLTRSLAARRTARGFASFSEYYHFLAFNPAAEPEWKELLELLGNRETGFFRHQPSFEALEKQVLPELLAERAKHGISALTAWSAGCSTGEEAWSLAMVMLDATTGRAVEVKVCGTDLSEPALARARRGLYRANALRGLSEPLRARHFLKTEQHGELCFEPNKRLRSAVELARLNLAHPADYWVGAQDIVFCHNVLIYFAPERRAEVAGWLAAKLRPKGYLFLAPGEVLGLKLPGFQPVRFDLSLAYQRTS